MAASGSNLDIAKWIRGASPNVPKSSNVINAKTDVSNGNRRGFALSDSVDGELTVVLDGSTESIVVQTQLAIKEGDRVYMTFDHGVYQITGFTETARSITDQEQELKDFSESVQESITKLESDISDGSITSYLGTEDPSLDTYPTNEWSTSDWSKHKGDLYLNTVSGKTWYWTGSSWDVLEDEDIKTALANAKEAQDTADRKRTFFMSSTLPTPPYEAGDLWSAGSDPDNEYTHGSLMACIQWKNEGATPSIDDWVEAIYYSDMIDNMEWQLGNLADTLNDQLAEINDQLDGKVEIFYGTVTPTTSNYPVSSWSSDEYSSHVGDLYYNTSTGYCYKFNGSGWDQITDSRITTALTNAQSAINQANTANSNAEDALDTAYTKAQIFTSTPTVPYYKGDMWCQTISSTKSSAGEIKVCKTTRTSGSYTSSDWVYPCDYTDDSAVDDLVTTFSVTNQTGYIYSHVVGAGMTTTGTRLASFTWRVYKPTNNTSAPIIAYASISSPNTILCTRANYYEYWSESEYLVTWPSAFGSLSSSYLPQVFLSFSGSECEAKLTQWYRSTDYLGPLIVVSNHSQTISTYRLEIMILSRTSRSS